MAELKITKTHSVKRRHPSTHPALRGLDPDERAAVSLPAGPALIVGGAGTGKTKVFAHRLAYLISRGPARSGERVVGIAAAARDVERSAQALEAVWPGLRNFPEIRTFSSFLKAFVGAHYDSLGFLTPPEIPENDWARLPLLEAVIEKTHLEYFGRSGHEAVRPEALIALFDEAERENAGVEEYERYVRKCGRTTPARPVRAEGNGADDFLKHKDIAVLYAAYEKTLRQKNIADTATLTRWTNDALARAEGAKTPPYGVRWHFVVDAFEDLSISELRLLRLLAASGGSITAIGDDDQACRSPSRSAFAAFERFLSIYPTAHLVRLTQAYRSPERMASAARRLIKMNSADRFGLEKLAKPARRAGEAVTVRVFSDVDEELLWLAKQIRRTALGRHSFSEMAVITRTEEDRLAAAHALKRAGIPVKDADGERVLSTGEARTFKALLDVMAQPGNDLAMLRLLRSARLGWASTWVGKLQESARRQRVSIFEALDLLRKQSIGCDPHAVEAIDEFRMRIKPLVSDAAKRDAHYCVRRALSLFPVTLSLARPGALEEDRILKSIAALVVEAAHFTRLYAERASLAHFLAYLAVLQKNEQRVRFPGLARGREGVSVLTASGAKGHEFPVVFIPSVTDRRYPFRPPARAYALPRELCRTQTPEGDVRLLGDRRLLYLAMTRASKVLYLSSVSNGRETPSAFLAEIARARETGAVRWVRPPKMAVDMRILFTQLAASARGREAGAPFRKLSDQLTRAGGRRPAFASGAGGRSMNYSLDALVTFRSCPLKYAFQYGYRLDGRRGPLRYLEGLLRKVIARFMRSGRGSDGAALSGLLDIFDALWDPGMFSGPREARRAHARGRHALNLFFIHQGKHALARPCFIEDPFCLRVDGVGVTGRIDHVLEHRDGAHELFSFAFRDAGRDAMDTTETLRLLVTAMAAESKLGRPVAYATYYDLDTAKTTRLSAETEDLLRALATVRTLAEQMTDGPYAACPEARTAGRPEATPPCRTCRFTDLCPAWARSNQTRALTPRETGATMSPLC